MPRISRVIAPGYPHHITQRGNRRQQTFFSDDDYQTYVRLMSDWCGKHNVEIWAYCLMPNHVHLIAVPPDKTSMSPAIGEAHRRYTRHINFREGWRGYLWQGRFASYVMNQRYLLACVRYIENNPVRAGLVGKPEEWPWSSARAHIAGKDDRLVTVRPLLDMVGGEWSHFLSEKISDEESEDLRKHERTGRPIGNKSFVRGLETILNRKLSPGKPGRKLKSNK